MHIREALLQEHTRINATHIANQAISSTQQLRALMDSYMDPDHRLSQRAAWSVKLAAKKKPSLILPYLPQLISRMQDPNAHPAVIRNAVRILEDWDIPESYHGEVMNACFGFVESPTTPAAIKAVSLTLLHKLSRHYPDIRPELKLIIEEKWDTETPAFKSRARKILQDLNKK